MIAAFLKNLKRKVLVFKSKKSRFSPSSRSYLDPKALYPAHFILKKLSKVLCLSFFLIGFFSSQVFQNNSLALGDKYNPYLSQEDLDFNLAQMVSSEEGFLVKNVPVSEEELQKEVEFKEHKVLDKEDLVAIANFYGLSVNTLIQENKIINVSDVKTNDIIKIPPTDGISHTVQTGENLSYIASLYSVDYSEIEAFNLVDVYSLNIGQKLFIPGGTRVTNTLIADSATKPTPSSTKVANLENVIDASILPEYPDPANIKLNTEETRPALEPQSPNTPQLPSFSLDSESGFSQGAEATIQDPKIVTVEKQVIVEVPKSRAKQMPPAPKTNTQWSRPTSGSVTQGYRRGHYALDIADTGRPAIWAAGTGIIEVAAYGWNSGFGNYIIIDHKNGYKTLYAHNTELYVKAGETVEKGQVIAKMGNTGRVYGATGIHLHYECHLEGIRINPHKCMP